MKNLIQIAGVRSVAEAKMLLDSGADYIGFPLRLAYHKPDLTEQELQKLFRLWTAAPRAS
jgi:phosphoribosylanthranilate isomerase